jgi:hypothetical protein
VISRVGISDAVRADIEVRDALIIQVNRVGIVTG